MICLYNYGESCLSFVAWIADDFLGFYCHQYIGYWNFAFRVPLIIFISSLIRIIFAFFITFLFCFDSISRSVYFFTITFFFLLFIRELIIIVAFLSLVIFWVYLLTLVSFSVIMPIVMIVSSCLGFIVIAFSFTIIFFGIIHLELFYIFIKHLVFLFLVEVFCFILVSLTTIQAFSFFKNHQSYWSLQSFFLQLLFFSFLKLNPFFDWSLIFFVTSSYQLLIFLSSLFILVVWASLILVASIFT